MIIEIVTQFILDVIVYTGYAGVFILMTFESAAIPIPSEIIMPFSGYLVYQGKLSFLAVVLAGAIGNVVGSLIAYFFGLKYGRDIVVKYGRYFLLRDHRMLYYAEHWFAKYGDAAAFFSRLLPIIRTYISIPAGVGRMKLWRFIWLTFIGSFIWSALLAYIGILLGPAWQEIIMFFRGIEIFLIIFALLFLIWWIRRRRSKYFYKKAFG